MSLARVIPPARLIFVRHGETEWNREGRLQGQQDIPLNALGREQAARSGRKLAKILGANREAPEYVASPLGRTRETMRIVRQTLGLDPDAYRVDPVLKELSFGKWEGLTWPEVEALSPELARRRIADKWGFVPPEGESYGLLALRIAPWLQALQADTVLVSHGGVARVMMALVGGLPVERAPQMDIWQDRPLIFADGRFDWV